MSALSITPSRILAATSLVLVTVHSPRPPAGGQAANAAPGCASMPAAPNNRPEASRLPEFCFVAARVVIFPAMNVSFSVATLSRGQRLKKAKKLDSAEQDLDKDAAATTCIT